MSLEVRFALAREADDPEALAYALGLDAGLSEVADRHAALVRLGAERAPTGSA